MRQIARLFVPSHRLFIRLHHLLLDTCSFAVSMIVLVYMCWRCIVHRPIRPWPEALASNMLVGYVWLSDSIIAFYFSFLSLMFFCTLIYWLHSCSHTVAKYETVCVIFHYFFQAYLYFRFRAMSPDHLSWRAPYLPLFCEATHAIPLPNREGVNPQFPVFEAIFPLHSTQSPSTCLAARHAREPDEHPPPTSHRPPPTAAPAMAPLLLLLPPLRLLPATRLRATSRPASPRRGLSYSYPRRVAAVLRQCRAAAPPPPAAPDAVPRWHAALAAAAGLYPAYVTAGAAVAVARPDAFRWFVALAPGSYTFALGIIMLAMGLTLELREFLALLRERPLSVSTPPHPANFGTKYFSISRCTIPWQSFKFQLCPWIQDPKIVTDPKEINCVFWPL